MVRFLVVLMTCVLMGIPTAAHAEAPLRLETTPAGAMALWTHSDPATVFASVTVATAQGHIRYQQGLFVVNAYNETLLDDLQQGDTVVIDEFAGVVIDGVPQIAATHRSAGYVVTWRVRLPSVKRS